LFGVIGLSVFSALYGVSRYIKDWEKIGNKPFLSLESWPKADESKIDLQAEEVETVVENVISDIRNVLKLVKVDKPKEIVLFVADKWKYKFFNSLKKEMEKTRDMGELIKKTMDKQHGKDISSLVPKLVKDPSKIPEVVLDQKTEIKALKDNLSPDNYINPSNLTHIEQTILKKIFSQIIEFQSKLSFDFKGTM